MAASHSFTGTHHCSILDGKEHGATHRQFNECTLHPGHEKFMTVDEFLNKEPSETGMEADWEISNVKNQIARTVRVVVHHTSVDRPDTFINSENPYPCKDIRGNNYLIRYGTGFLVRRCNGCYDNGNDDDNNDNGVADDDNDDDHNNNGDDDDNEYICGNGYYDDSDDDNDTGNDNADEDYDNGNNDDDKDDNNDDNNDDIDNGNDDDDYIDFSFFYVKIPCPCLDCETSTCQTLNRKSYYFAIRTATHVIFDEQEAQKSRFELFYDSEDRSNVVMLYGVTVLESLDLRLQTDCCTVVCVTHDGSLADKLGRLCMEGGDWWKRNVFISHPHGVSKRISVGDYTSQSTIVVIPNKESVQLKKGTEIRFPDCLDDTRIVQDINRLLDKRVIGRKWVSKNLVLRCNLKVFRPESVVMETDWDDYFEFKGGKIIRKNKVWCNFFHPGTQLVTDDGKRYTFPYNDDKVPKVNMEVFVKTKYFIDKKEEHNHRVFLYRRHSMASCPGSSGAHVGFYGDSRLHGPHGHVHFGNCGDFNTSSLHCIHSPDDDEQDYNKKALGVMGVMWNVHHNVDRHLNYNSITGI